MFQNNEYIENQNIEQNFIYININKNGCNSKYNIKYWSVIINL